MKVFILVCILGLAGCGKDTVQLVPGPMGPPGERGLVGANGATGATGSPGINGTSVTVVKVCPGDTVYPSKFVEVAIRVDSRLYAVYSSMGGFLTELVPGAYLSDTVGSRCNFTVNNNLEIIN